MRKRIFRVECQKCEGRNAYYPQSRHTTTTFSTMERARKEAHTRTGRGCVVRVTGPEEPSYQPSPGAAEVFMSLARIRDDLDALVVELQALVADAKHQIWLDMVAYIQEHLPEGARDADHASP